MQVDFIHHDLKPSAADAIAKVISTPFLTSGVVGRVVEEQIAEYFGTGREPSNTSLPQIVVATSNL